MLPEDKLKQGFVLGLLIRRLADDDVSGKTFIDSLRLCVAQGKWFIFIVLFRLMKHCECDEKQFVIE